MRFLLVVLNILMGTFVFAHNSNEINYIIQKNQDQWQLRVHFTPQTAIQLIEYLKPELQNQAVLKLADYHSDFTKYFNQTISLQFEKESVSLQFLNADLNRHDAVMDFVLVNMPESFADYEIVINSFEQIYKHYSNFVKVESNSGTYTCSLNKRTRVCANNLAESSSFDKETALFWIMIIGLFSAFFYLVYDATKPLNTHSIFNNPKKIT